MCGRTATRKACTRAPALRVETPSTYATPITWRSAFSLHRRGPRKKGKYEPFRSLGISKSSRPTRVCRVRGRVPLHWFARGCPLVPLRTDLVCGIRFHETLKHLLQALPQESSLADTGVVPKLEKREAIRRFVANPKPVLAADIRHAI